MNEEFSSSSFAPICLALALSGIFLLILSIDFQPAELEALYNQSLHGGLGGFEKPWAVFSGRVTKKSADNNGGRFFVCKNICVGVEVFQGEKFAESVSAGDFVEVQGFASVYNGKITLFAPNPRFASIVSKPKS